MPERWVSREETPGAGEPDAPDEGAPASNGGPDDPAQPLDPEVLEGLRELGGPELLSELTQVFLADADGRLAALREALQSGDASGVERTAHALKGASGNMGAGGMAALCAELQEAGASGDLTRAGGLLDQLAEELDRVRPALEAEMARSAP